jgi:hypothetical protein
VKKECDRILATNKKPTTYSPNPKQPTTGQLRHITEEGNLDTIEVEDEVHDNEFAMLASDTNEDELLYFARLTKHYLRVVKNNPNAPSVNRHDMPFSVIANSGANYHMFQDKEFFESISPASGNAILGDGKTTLPILGVGTVKCKIGSNILSIPNVRYIPGLGESVYSLLIHIKTPGHGLDSSFENGLYLTFPSFKTQAIVGSHDISLDMNPCLSSTTSEFKLLSSLEPDTSTFCRDLTQVDQLSENNVQIDNILRELRCYYRDVKTKCQLGLQVPAVFRPKSNFQQQIILHTPPRKSAKGAIESDSLSSLNDLENMPTPVHSNLTSDLTLLLLCNDTSLLEPSFIPIIHSVDKPSSSLPKFVSMTEDYLRACVGYRRIDTLKKNLISLYQPTITLDNTPPDAISDPGYYATFRKKDRNTTPVPRPEKFGDVFHIDMVFGPEISIGNVHYGLICVDRFSRMTYVYPLQNLTSDIQKQLESLFAHLGMIPKRIIKCTLWAYLCGSIQPHDVCVSLAKLDK